MHDYSALKKLYNSRKKEINSRLNEFRQIGLCGSEKQVFTELCFCLLTPQAKAKLCWEAVNNLLKKNLLLKGKTGQISCLLNKVRFKNTKAGNIVSARKIFLGSRGLHIRFLFKQIKDTLALRDWLVKNIRGMGLKEASHFLRNIGSRENIAILDRHILKNLVSYGVIREIPQYLNRKRYLDIEAKMVQFAKKVDVPLSHLDLLFWSMETGEIFK
jgi:N-glycosylase/DNA lyase